MKRALVVAILSVLTFPLAGCGGTMVREGIWEITWNIQESSTRLPWPVPKRIVKVRVEKDRSGDGEIVEISPLFDAAAEHASTAEDQDGRNPALEVKPMYGYVRVQAEDQPPVMQVEAADSYWRWAMWGIVRSSEYVTSTHFAARLRRSDKLVVLDGWWSMRWIREH